MCFFLLWVTCARHLVAVLRETEVAWSGLRLLAAGSYKVCACRIQGESCDTGADFDLEVQTFAAFGPTAVRTDPLDLTAGEAFRLLVDLDVTAACGRCFDPLEYVAVLHR